MAEDCHKVYSSVSAGARDIYKLNNSGAFLLRSLIMCMLVNQLPLHDILIIALYVLNYYHPMIFSAIIIIYL